MSSIRRASLRYCASLSFLCFSLVVFPDSYILDFRLNPSTPAPFRTYKYRTFGHENIPHELQLKPRLQQQTVEEALSVPIVMMDAEKESVQKTLSYHEDELKVARTIEVSIDLVLAAKRQLGFLRTIDSLTSLHTSGPAVLQAIQR